MIRIVILVLTLVLALPAYAQVCPGGSTCQTLGTVITGTSQNVAPSSGDVVPTVHGTTVQNIPTQQLLAGPTVANLTALRAACTSTSGCPSGHFVFPNGVTRLTDGVAGAPPLYFTIGSGACSTDDGASCVNSADGNQWDGVFSAIGLDAREWGFTAGSGSTDQAPALQAALTYAGTSNSFGGTVIAPNGIYTLKSQLVIPHHVTLQCIANPTTAGTLGVAATSGGTMFSIQWGNGSGNSNNPSDAAVQLRGAATIDSCGFTYPGQVYTATTPVEYGATILIYDTGAGADGGNAAQTATRNFCFNCYSFLDFRGSIANSGVSNATIQYNWGAPVAFGLRLNFVGDWSHYDHNIFHNGAYDFGDSSFFSHLPGWTANNGIAFELGNSDWLNLTDEQEWGYDVGVSIIYNGTYYTSKGPIWIKNSQFDACQFACILDTPSSADNGIFALRVVGNTLVAYNPATGGQSGSMGGIGLSINGNSSPQVVVFSDNFIFGPTNYAVFGNGAAGNTDVTISGNTSYPNVSSTIAASGPAFTLGAGTTLTTTNNTMHGWGSVQSVVGSFTNVTNTGNFVN